MVPWPSRRVQHDVVITLSPRKNIENLRTETDEKSNIASRQNKEHGIEYLPSKSIFTIVTGSTAPAGTRALPHVKYLWTKGDKTIHDHEWPWRDQPRSKGYCRVNLCCFSKVDQNAIEWAKVHRVPYRNIVVPHWHCTAKTKPEREMLWTGMLILSMPVICERMPKFSKVGQSTGVTLRNVLLGDP